MVERSRLNSPLLMVAFNHVRVSTAAQIVFADHCCRWLEKGLHPTFVQNATTAGAGHETCVCTQDEKGSRWLQCFPLQNTTPLLTIVFFVRSFFVWFWLYIERLKWRHLCSYLIHCVGLSFFYMQSPLCQH